MAQVFNLSSRPSPPTVTKLSSPENRLLISKNYNGGRFTCLFSPNNRNKQEQARKALESALGGKKKEFENWDREIKKREEVGRGGNGGGGIGWFRWFGGSNDDHFWPEAQQTSLTVLCIVLVCFILAKGDVMLAVFLNPLLFALRGPRNAFTFMKSWILQKVAPAAYSNLGNTSGEDVYTRNSAKDTVVRKWGTD